MPYELIDHTADLGIAVTAETISGLFETAAHAMFDQIIHRQQLSGFKKAAITVFGIDKSDLMINWLRELLFFWHSREWLIRRVRIKRMNADKISAEFCYDPFDPAIHKILSDIKAVTYHDIQVKKTSRGWRASIIFDV